MLITGPEFVGSPTGLPLPRRPQAAPPVTRPPRMSAQAAKAGIFRVAIEAGIASGMTRGQAIRKAIERRPDEHLAWLAEFNAR